MLFLIQTFLIGSKFWFFTEPSGDHGYFHVTCYPSLSRWVLSAFAATKVKLDMNLARILIKPFGKKPKSVLFGLMLVTAVFSMFMSNTATANLLLLIMSALGTSLSGLGILGGGRLMILMVAISASLAMALPISTPPNALAYGIGHVKSIHMLKTGSIIGVMGLVSLYFLMFILNKEQFITG